MPTRLCIRQAQKIQTLTPNIGVVYRLELMRCNACWNKLEGEGIATPCGHLFCTKDANRILNDDGKCSICDEEISKSLMKSVEINPSDEWTNIVMAGISPDILMKSAFKSIMFYTGQKELEMQFRMKMLVAQCQKKGEMMQETLSEKLEQAHSAYQNMAKRMHMLEQEVEILSKDKQELQQKLAEKSRQKRKLDEMYDDLRSELFLVKPLEFRPGSNFCSRNNPDLFTNIMVDNTDHLSKASWNERCSSVPINVSGGYSTVKPPTVPVTAGRREAPPIFGAGTSAGATTSRIYNISPTGRPQPSHKAPQFTF